MTIQWFPGHMKETEQFLKKAVSNVDVVMEILDARLPASSANPLLDKICNTVLRIKVLNKSDLADPVITRLWIDYFKTIQRGSEVIAITGTDTADTWRAADMALTGVKQSRSRRIRIMVAGIPNTGKSTIMNTLAGKKVAKTGNVPAITRYQQRTAIKNRIDIYDTPGILWPVLENLNGAYRLAASGAISDTAIDYNDVALFTLKYLITRYPDALKERYLLSDSIDDNGGPLILETIGASRGCLRKGGVVDIQKASELLIREFRSGKLGGISLESPEDFLSESLLK
ncbi:MAG: ribosome biogenesis GTPase YlqF [Desulfamplus sp.]|nr:ribosome biogenesis GTPase YlqF [Desulfamplus sp.]